MAVTKHLKLTAGLRGCCEEVGGCSGSGPSPGAAGCAARVQGHLYPCRLCPDLHGRRGWGQQMGLPTGWTDFLCRVMPRTGFRDKGVGPRTTFSIISHSCRFFPYKLSEKLDVLIFSKASVISTHSDASGHNMCRTVSISWCGIWMIMLPAALRSRTFFLCTSPVCIRSKHWLPRAPRGHARPES